MLFLTRAGSQDCQQVKLMHSWSFMELVYSASNRTFFRHSSLLVFYPGSTCPPCPCTLLALFKLLLYPTENLLPYVLLQKVCPPRPRELQERMWHFWLSITLLVFFFFCSGNSLRIRVWISKVATDSHDRLYEASGVHRNNRNQINKLMWLKSTFAVTLPSIESKI